jgi:hypothetical protein
MRFAEAVQSLRRLQEAPASAVKNLRQIAIQAQLRSRMRLRFRVAIAQNLRTLALFVESTLWNLRLFMILLPELI